MVKLEEIRRAFEDIAKRIDDETYINAATHFTTGFLLGGDNAWGAALVVALAERTYGAGMPGLTDLKRKIGLAASHVEDYTAPSDD
jgi:hypothetical protein